MVCKLAPNQQIEVWKELLSGANGDLTKQSCFMWQGGRSGGRYMGHLGSYALPVSRSKHDSWFGPHTCTGEHEEVEEEVDEVDESGGGVGDLRESPSSATSSSVENRKYSY